MVDLVGKHTVPYSGSAVTYVVADDGKVRVKLWGAGGGGNFYSGFPDGTPMQGGGGGFTYLEVDAIAGDEIKVEVGQGGRNANGPGGLGGAGGWPDGGTGGNNYGYYQIGAGGGGSTRVYLNDVLVGVAGAGGGGGGTGGVSPPAVSGYGGGTAGSNAHGTITGGSQSAGGVNSNTNASSESGGYLQGGNGYASGFTNARTDVTNNPAGGGGGGGYYGGAGGGSFNANNNSYAFPGAGGSGFASTDPEIAAGSTEAAVGQASAGADDLDYVAGVGVGGWSIGGSMSGGGVGGNGYAIVEYLEPLPEAENSLVYQGVARSFEAPANGTIEIEMWGGGGGGGRSDPGWGGAIGPGGAGGYTTVSFGIAAGDILTVEVGQGGRKGAGPSANGGLGGWPDGGAGGAYAPGAPAWGLAGGGGSSRIWLNGELLAVAGAGGGGLNGGGAGGGVNGEDAPVQPGGVNNVNSGASQTQGGFPDSFSTYASAPTLVRGSFLKGGNGWADGSGGQNTNNTTPSSRSGCGGGGGYYGGSGGANGDNQVVSGGGGSGWYDDTFVASGTTTAGVLGVPYDNANRPSGVAVGGTTSSSAPTDGGDGFVLLTYSADAGEPGDGTGDFGDAIDVHEPVATAAGNAMGEGEWDPITVTAPSASATGGAATGTLTIPAVTLSVPTVSTSATATVIVPINDDVEIFITSVPEGSAVGEFTPIEVPIDIEVIIQPPVGSGHVSIDLSADIATVAVIPPEGMGFTGVIGEGDFGPDVVITPPEASAVGLAHIDAPASDAGPGERYWARITIREEGSPQGYVTAIGTATGEPLPQPTVVLTPPEGFGEEGIAAFSEPFENDITITPPEGEAFGSALARSLNQGSAELPEGIYLALVRVGDARAPQAAGSASVVASGLPATAIRVTAPRSITNLAANLAVAMPRRVEVRPPQGRIIFSGDALGYGETPPVIVTPPEAFVTIDGQAPGDALGENFPAIIVTPPTAIAQGNAEAVVALPTIRVRVLDAYAEVDVNGFAPLRFRRSRQAGYVFDSLAEREIGVNEADGVLYTRDGEGNLRGTPYLALAEGGIAPEGGSVGQVLDHTGTWIDPEPVYDAPIRADLPSGTRVVLSEGALGVESVTPAKAIVFYRPFFVPRAVEIADLGVEVLFAAPATAHIGVCTWNLTGTPGSTLISGSVDTSETGFRAIPADLTLSPGWYAAMFALTGVGSPILRGITAPKRIAADFTLQGDPTAPGSSLSPAPTPDAFATSARALLQAETA